MDILCSSALNMRRFLRWCFIVLPFWRIGIATEPVPCTTPNNEKATCKQLYDCDVLVQSLTSKDPTLKKFFEASKCGDFFVCCGTVGNYTNNSPNVTKQSETTSESHRDYVIRNLLPSTAICGLQHTDDYFHNYTTTSVDEFPWLVYIKQKSYTNDTDLVRELRCVGTIINRRYFITDSVCFSHYPIEEVRIGQYNRFKDSDCIQTPYGPDCADPAISVEIEEKLTFKGLVLVRFKRGISYSDYIRPICLPLNETTRPKVDDLVVSSGWGDFPIAGLISTLKKKVFYKVANPPEDRKNAPANLVFVDLVNSTLNNKNNDYDCSGDEGGPLMYKINYQWFVHALIFVNFCLGLPAQKLTQESVEWIIENMRP